MAQRHVHLLMKHRPSVERMIGSMITSPNDSLVVPFIDHLGPLTDALLSRRFASLTVCEPDETVRKDFEKHARARNPNLKIRTFPDDIMELLYLYNHEDTQRKCDAILMDAIGASERSIPRGKIKFLAPIMKPKGEGKMLANIYYQTALRHGLCSRVLVHYYLNLSNFRYQSIMAKPSGNLSLYRSSTVLLNALFTPRRLDSFDKDPDGRKTNGTVHLVEMEPKLHVINSLPPKSLVEFRSLVSQLMFKRKAPIKSLVEQWFGESYCDFAALDINETTRAGDISVDQYIELYRILKGHPKYERSSFIMAAKQLDHNYSYN